MLCRSDLWVLKRGADAPAAVEATHDAAASAPNGGTSTIIPIMDVINVESLARNLSVRPRPTPAAAAAKSRTQREQHAPPVLAAATPFPERHCCLCSVR